MSDVDWVASMKRKYRYIVLAAAVLFCGVVVNVAVAWAMAVWLPRASPSTMREAPSWAMQLPNIASEERKSIVDEDWVRHGPGWSQCDEYRGYVERTPVSAGMWYEDSSTLAAGWPMRALRFVEYTVTEHAPVDRTAELSWLRRGVLVPDWVLKIPKAKSFVQGRRLPLEPLAGFAVNTIFYAAILAVPLSVRPIRRHLRARRGRCWKCGYDMSGVTAECCPECGNDHRRLKSQP